MARKRGGLLLLLGAIVGAITALFFSTTEEGETREVVRQKVKDLKKMLKDAKEKEAVKDIFGEKTDEVVQLFRDAKEDLVSRLAKVKGSLDSIDKSRYMEAVNEVSVELKKNASITGEQLNKMKAYMSEDYKKISKKMKKRKA